MPEMILPARAPDPRVRLVCALALSIAVATLTTLPAAITALCAGIAILAITGTPFHSFRHRLMAVNLFILFMWLITPFTMQGPVIATFGIFKASQTGVIFCLLVTLKANALMAIFICFLRNLSLFSIGSALMGLGMPPKLAIIFMFMERNVSILEKQWKKLRQAATLRGFIPKTSLYSYKVIATLMGLMLLSAHSNAQKLHEALLLRGFHGYIPAPAPLRLRMADLACCAFTIFISSALICANYFTAP